MFLRWANGKGTTLRAKCKIYGFGVDIFFILTIDGPLQEPSSERKTASGVPQGVPQTYVGRGGCGAGLSD